MASHPIPEADESAREIVVNGRPMQVVTADALAALARANDPPRTFVRGGALARVRRDERQAPIIDTLDFAQLRGVMERSGRWTYEGKNGPRPTPPPREVVDDVLALGEWDFPPLAGLIEAPALRPDGTVIDTPGYDLATGLLYAPDRRLTVPPIPQAPTRAQVAAAVDLIAEGLGEFPYIDDASRANAFAFFLTPAVRPAIRGGVPLALFDGTKAGTGKGLGINVVAYTATGREAAMIAAPTREEEWSKTIPATLAAGPSMVVIDEAELLRSPALALALTASTVKARVLGYSRMIEVPQRASWAAAGNNIRLGGDMPRRCYRIRLDAKTARPWQRDGFRHDPLLEWVAEHRGALIVAQLTLARAWYAAGKPAASVPTVGAFESWSRVVGGILQHAGVGGFLDNLVQMYEEADEESPAWEAFLTAWRAHYAERSATVAELYYDLTNTDALREALPGDLAEALDRGAGSFKTKLGKALGKRAGTRFGDDGLRIERASTDARSGVAAWRTETDR